jgi:hypothetical protein
MTRLELMTWREESKRWVKCKYGQQYVVSCRQLGTAPTKHASREAANKWWNDKLREIEKQEAAPTVATDDPQNRFAVQSLDHMIHWWRQQGNDRLADRLRDDLAVVKKKIRSGQPLTALELDPFSYLDERSQAVWRDRFRTLDSQDKKVAKDRTIKAHAKALLDHKEAQVIGKERSVGRWGAVRAHLDYFCNWIGDNQSIEALNSTKLQGFYTHLLRKKEFSQSYKRDMFASAKMLIQFVAENDLIPLPGNLRSRSLSFRKMTKKVKVFEVDELHELLTGATQSTMLYLYLMMNCGMQQQDISDLRHGAVDWVEGRITRKRSKTEHHAEVPEVTYLLWPETLRLLKAHRSSDPERVLVTKESKPLKQEEIVDGVLSKSDNIQSAYRRLLAKLDIPQARRKPLKLIRKTSASILETHKEYGRYVQHFLGHSPRTIAEGHYVIPDQTNFDEAVSWLGEKMLARRKTRATGSATPG